MAVQGRNLIGKMGILRKQSKKTIESSFDWRRFMRVGDLKIYIFDEVVIYRENSKIDEEYIDVYKGFLCTSPTSILNLKVRTIEIGRAHV